LIQVPSAPARPSYFVGPWELSHATAHLPSTPAAGRVLLIESTTKDSALPYHRWKLVLVLSALRHFVAELRAAGFEVDHRVATTYADGIRAHMVEFAPSEVLVQEPAEWGVGQSLRMPSTPFSAPLRFLPDRRFLTTRGEFTEWARGRKLFRMEDFYRWQRKRLGILMDAGGQPVGGVWNLDRENRESARALQRRLRASGGVAAPRSFPPDQMTGQVMRQVERLGSGVAPDGGPQENGHWGKVEGFDLPVTREQALLALEDFLAHRLAEFGPSEDAMLSGEGYLFHSRLSAAMNVGLLHPAEMVQAAVERWAAGEAGTAKPAQGGGTRRPAPPLATPVPLSSVEGFVRQIIGWREYVNGIYWREMPGYRAVNYFGFSRPLPQLYWEPERTELACLRDSVRMVRDTGYAHHIHRLMILCNFAVLTGVHPLRLSEWFWAGFADAMEWVELPNVVGMGTFGDGGLLASKPYVSSAAYINRMSNYCGGCRYNPGLRTGPDACPFNFLYWTFLDDVKRRKLDVGQRMALVLKGLERIPAAELGAMRQSRERFLDGLEPDDTGWAFRHDEG